MAKQSNTKAVHTPAQKQAKAKDKHLDFAFGKENYILMFIGLAVLALGYICMIGGGSKDFKVFNYSLFDFQRLTLAPALILIGFIIEIVAIMKKPKDKKTEE